MAMTPPFDPDELASAYLDGEVTPEEAALVEGDPALRARVEDLRRVAGALGSPVPPPTGSADRLVERAVVVGTAPQARSVDERARARRWVLAGLSAAAAVGILGLAANVLLDDGDPTTSQLAGGDASQEADDLFEGGAAPADLGDIETDQELREQVADATGLVAADTEAFAPDEAPAAESEDVAESDAAPGGAPTSGPLVPPPAGEAAEPISEECEIELVTREPAIAGQLFQATATYEDEASIVYVYARPDDSPVVFVVARDGCEELTSFALDG